MFCCNGNNQVDPDDMVTEAKKLVVVEERQATDVCAGTLFAFFILFDVIVVIVASLYGDTRTVIRGYDDNGNVCGINNSKIPGVEGSGQDKVSQRFVVYIQECKQKNHSDCIWLKHCSNKCPSTNPFVIYNRCFRRAALKRMGIREKMSEISYISFMVILEDLIAICAMALGLNILVCILLRYCSKFIPWILMGFIVVTIIIMCIIAWHLYAEAMFFPELTKIFFDRRFILFFLIMVNIILIVSIFIILGMRHHTVLVYKIFNETSTVLKDMPLLLLQPFVDIFILFIILTLWILGFLFLTSVQYLSIDNGRVVYKTNPFFYSMRIYHFVTIFIIHDFVSITQHLRIAGAVATWYTAENKHDLQSPILKSSWRTFRYHLGSVAFGTIIVTLFRVTKLFLYIIQKVLCYIQPYVVTHKEKLAKVIKSLDTLLSYISLATFYQIAMSGSPYTVAAVLVFKTVKPFPFHLNLINTVGDMSLFTIKIVITLLTIEITTQVFRAHDMTIYIMVPVTIAFIFANNASTVFIGIFETTIGTLFLCLCKDVNTNNGRTRPYLMRQELRDFTRRFPRLSEVGSGLVLPTQESSNQEPSHHGGSHHAPAN